MGELLLFQAEADGTEVLDEGIGFGAFWGFISHHLCPQNTIHQPASVIFCTTVLDQVGLKLQPRAQCEAEYH